MSRISNNVKQKATLRQYVVRGLGVLSLLIALGFTIFFLMQEEDSVASTTMSSTIDTDGDGVFDVTDLDDDNDGIPDTKEGISRVKEFTNGSFEEGPFPSGYGLYTQSQVQGWSSTVSGSYIEIWKSGFNSTPAVNGNYFIELNSTNKGSVYQQLSVNPGDVISYSFYHRGRSGEDQTKVYIGPSGSIQYQMLAKTGKTAWKKYSGTYTVPSNVTSIWFYLYAYSSSGNSSSVGNFIDDVRLQFIDSDDVDFDGDGIPNRIDLDSDDDGIFDVIEGGGSDPDGNGIIGGATINDSDGDGLDDSIDTDNGGTPLTVADTDDDGNYDFVDFDADGDGIVDLVEGRNTSDFVQLMGIDSDLDGIDNAFEQSKSIAPLADTDTDGIPDYLDLDSDDDGISDATEAYDANVDGQMDVSYSYGDYDADGVDNTFDADGTSTTNSNGSVNQQSPLYFPKAAVTSAEPYWRHTGSDGGNLPIELLVFTAEAEGSDILLKWKTATEINNDQFYIARSYDGVQFEVIGNKDGAGTSNSVIAYEYLDKGPEAGTIYYRLSQVDFDGESETFDPVTVSLQAVQPTIERIYPNPFINEFTVAFQLDMSTEVQVHLYNSAGQLVLQSKVEGNEGLNNVTIVDDRNLKAGYYYCVLYTDGQKSASIKLIKAKQ